MSINANRGLCKFPPLFTTRRVRYTGSFSNPCAFLNMYEVRFSPLFSHYHDFFAKEISECPFKPVYLFQLVGKISEDHSS